MMDNPSSGTTHSAGRNEGLNLPGILQRLVERDESSGQREPLSNIIVDNPSNSLMDNPSRPSSGTTHSAGRNEGLNLLGILQKLVERVESSSQREPLSNITVDNPSIPASTNTHTARRNEGENIFGILRSIVDRYGSSSHRALPYINFEDVYRVVVQNKRMSASPEDLARYQQLSVAIQQKDWKNAENFIRENPRALKTNITEDSSTFFHWIAMSDDQDGGVQLLQKFIRCVGPETLEEKDGLGSTPLHVAAVAGNTKVAKLLVDFNRNLPNISEPQLGYLPLHAAAGGGHRETVKYLLKVTSEDVIPFDGPNGFLLVNLLLRNNLYDIAYDLLKQHPTLVPQQKQQRGNILETLAKRPMAFKSGSRLGYWQRLIYYCTPVQEKCSQTQKNRNFDGGKENLMQGPQSSLTKAMTCGFLRQMARKFGAWSQKLHILLWKVLILLVPGIRNIYETKLTHMQTVEIVRMMCAGVFWSFEEAVVSLKMPVLISSRLGIHEIVKEILKAAYCSLCFFDEDGHNMLMLAILHRQENVYKLAASQMGNALKNLMANFNDKSANNILHLAGCLATSSQVPGAALQMQRELQWFKAVENFVPPSLQEQRNSLDRTPMEEFTENHKELVKEGEKWMKDTATSCTVAAALIITVVFAAAFTVPGGNNQDSGIPIFLNKLPFIVFLISDGLALISSTTSLLMFLGILTSRYSEEDFLVSLPKKLIIGLMTLFFSIATMVIAFGATIYIVLSHPWKLVIVPIVLLCCLPVTLFACLHFPLFVDMFLSTYRPSLFQPINWGKDVNL